jgi:threonine/homoserine/homoserine lactone efflux protein
MSLPQSIATLISGIVVGITVAAPVGPMGILCIQRTLTFGATAGLATGLGAATVHLAFSALAVVGLGAVIEPWVEANSIALGVLSGVILFWFAVRMRRHSVDVAANYPVHRIRLVSAYVGAIGLGVANPLTIVLFCAALHTIVGQPAGLLLVAGVFIGSATWWTILSGTVAAARLRIDAGILGLSHRFASLMLMALGTFALAKACGQIVK